MKRIIEINIGDAFYPNKLNSLYKPPEKLYCIGDISLLNTKSIASIGSRNCTNYGRTLAYEIGKMASINNITLISGMAKGIDYYSHLGTLDNRGKTIAVLGCGVDVCYPKENRDIYLRIKENGLIISEYPPGFKPAKYTFPMRNRIIAALSEAVVVCEAEISSGSMITAEIANEMGKDVIAIPGNIFSNNSLGTNKLICDGAKPISTISDIFYSIGIKNVKNSYLASGEEELLIKIINNSGEISIKELARKSNFDESKIKEVVAKLEMKNLVSYYMGKVFVAN